MATVGSKILASDYNAVQSQVATVMGTGTSNYGYGQTAPRYSSSQLVGKPGITALQWNNLLNDLVNAYQHQGSINNLAIPQAPTTSTIVTAADYALYVALGNSIVANANATPPSGQASLFNFPAAVKTTSWNGIVYHNVVLTFPNANAARYYFNSGSNFQFTASLTNYPGYPGYPSGADASYAKDSDWNMLLNNMATITFNYNSTTCSGSYTSILSNVGYYQLTTTPQNIFKKQTASPTYTPNQYDIYASVDATGAIITFSIRFEDLSTGHPGNPYGVDRNVEGTLTSQVSAYYATSSSSSSGVQVALPTFSQSGP